MVSVAQAPRVRSVPPAVGSRGLEAIQAAESVGLILDEWQRDVLMGACGVDEENRWAAFEIGVDVPRQNGKGGIIEARELAGVLAFEERVQLHSAHEFQTSSEAMLRMEDLLASTPDVSKRVKSVSRSHGNEGFVFKNGCRLRYRTRTKGGGRGFTADTLYLDEAMILQEPFVAALLYTLSGRSETGNPQVWYTGSAVDQLALEHGVVFASLRERGHAGGDPSLAWYEWGLDAANPSEVTFEQASDPASWAIANPALGIRIAEAHVAKELRSASSLRTFIVERLGVGDWPATDGSGSVIDLELWLELVNLDSRLEGRPVLAFDVSPDRSSSSIAAADENAHVEIVEHRAGTGWICGRLLELVERHNPIAVIADGIGPAGSLMPELAQAGVTVTAISQKEAAQACGVFYDLVEQRRLRHLGSGELAAALRSAAKRPLGDAWAWSRRSSGADITPLVAATLATWGAQTMRKPDGPVFAWA